MRRVNLGLSFLLLALYLSVSVSSTSANPALCSNGLCGTAAIQGQEVDPLSPCSVAKQDDESQPASTPVSLSGKLGGSRADAELLYGKPVDDGLFIEYAIPGCGTVFIDYFDDHETIDISAFSRPKDQDKKLEEPDDADWSIAEAKVIVTNFLPSDAVEVGTLVQDKGLIVVEGFSPTLEQQVSHAAYDYGDNTPTYGGYQYAFHLTTDGKVSWINVQLSVEDEF